MISNLKAKLDHIAKDKHVAQKQASAADETCWIYADQFTLEALRRDYSCADIGEISIKSAPNVFRQSTDPHCRLEDIVFFDTETTGLSHGAGTLAFLIGLGYFRDGVFLVEQFLMKDYCQEKNMLQRLVDKLSSFQIAVSFNGKSFDAPILASRSVINRIMQPLDRLMHWDLLHAARRMYKARLQSCSLKSIESNILGFERCGDIPGAEIPEIFFQYVKHNDSNMIDSVIKHNRMDIVSLFVLMAHLCTKYQNPDTVINPFDLYSIARIFEQDGDEDKAKQCYIKSADHVKEAYLRLAFMSKRNSDYRMAIEYFDQYAKTSGYTYMPDIEISKIYEHHILDYQSAILYAERARQKVLGQGAFSMEKQVMESVNSRLIRVKRKLERKAGLVNGD